jgi:uncharacterized protein
MQIDLSQINEPVHRIDAVFRPDEIELDEEGIVFGDEIIFSGTLEKHIHRIDIEGNIKTKASVACGRCLKPLETQFDISFTSSFVPAEFETAETEVEVAGDDLNIEFYSGDEIDLARLVREQIVLNLPQTFLCTPDCLGLCEKCGVNKNEKTCECIEREIDPRLKVLENLIREKKD